MSSVDQTRQDVVFEGLRRSILKGTLPSGARLPPTRRLAQELGVARQTIVLVYERLAAEGYVRGRSGSGTYVAAEMPDQALVAAQTARVSAMSLSDRGVRLANLPATATRRDPALGLLLAGGLPAPDLFPYRAWARCAARVLKPLTADIVNYPPPQGLRALQEQIAAHLVATRGMVVEAGCIVVTAGTQQALHTAAELLLDPGDPVWVEDPGYISGRGALMAAGAKPVPIPNDQHGMNIGAGIQVAPRRGWLWSHPPTQRR